MSLKHPHRRVLFACLVIGGSLLAAGCTDGSGQPSTAATTTTTAVSPLLAFDPCAVFPPSFLAAEQLTKFGKDKDWKVDDGRECSYGYKHPDGHVVTVIRTSRTLAGYRTEFADSYREDVIGGRKVAYYNQFPTQAARGESCTLAVELTPGTVSFDVYNPKSAARVSPRNACDLLREFVAKALTYVPVA